MIIWRVLGQPAEFPAIRRNFALSGDGHRMRPRSSSVASRSRWSASGRGHGGRRRSAGEAEGRSSRTGFGAPPSDYLPTVRKAIEAAHGRALRTLNGRVVSIEGAPAPRLRLDMQKTPLTRAGATSRCHHPNPAEADGRWRGRGVSQ